MLTGKIMGTLLPFEDFGRSLEKWFGTALGTDKPAGRGRIMEIRYTEFGVEARADLVLELARAWV
ncbi:MAG: hypothetical protein M1299_09605 [Firmicutes bacterium]|nr:hypothetical protein [Bacillota bacterium]MCL5040059.1 hypothetical protein [Bacillota bacterium]